MKIADLKARQEGVNLIVEVVDAGEVREFEKFGRVGKVANATVKDDSGQIKLTLWNEDTGKFELGNKLKITNGFVREFQGEKQLTAGRNGKVELAEEGEGKAENTEDTVEEIEESDEEEIEY